MKNKITLHGKQYAYIERGEGDPILLLHGWCDQSDDYVPLIRQLSKDYRVIAPDLPNFGDSDKMTFSTEPYIFFIKSLCDTLRIDPIVIGHSFGGRLALHMNFTRILINPAGLKMEKSRIAFMLSVIYNTLYELSKSPYMMSILIHWFVNAMRNALRRDFWKYFNEVLFSDADIADAPTTILWSKDDKIFPQQYLHELQTKLYDSQFFIMKGGHFSCILDAPAFGKKINDVLSR